MLSMAACHSRGFFVAPMAEIRLGGFKGGQIRSICERFMPSFDVPRRPAIGGSGIERLVSPGADRGARNNGAVIDEARAGLWQRLDCGKRGESELPAVAIGDRGFTDESFARP